MHKNTDLCKKNASIVCANSRLFCLFLLWIFDTCMVDALQPVDEHLFGHGDVTEGDGAFAEKSLLHLSVNQLVDHFADGLVGILIK